jgi:hypothetical protein
VGQGEDDMIVGHGQQSVATAAPCNLPFRFCKSSLETSQELSPEDRTENFDGQKELRVAGNPSTMIGESPPPGTTQCRWG